MRFSYKKHLRHVHIYRSDLLDSINRQNLFMFLRRGVCRATNINRVVSFPCRFFGGADKNAGAGVSRVCDADSKAVLDLLSKKKLNEAFRFIGGMKRQGKKPSRIAYKNLIHKLLFSKTQHPDRAKAVLGMMREDGLDADRPMYGSLIKKYLDKRLPHRAHDVMDKMIKDGVTPDVVTYTIFVKAHCDAGDLEEANRTMATMREKGVMPNEITYGTMLYGLCEKKRLSDAVKMFGAMIEDGVKPNGVICTTMLRGWIKDNRMNEASEFYKLLRSRGLTTSNSVPYVAIMKGWCELRRMDRATSVLRDMIEDGVTPNATTYNTLMDGWISRGTNARDEMREIVQLLLRMKAEHVRPDMTTYNTVLKACCRVGEMNRAKAIFDAMRADPLCQPDEFSYNTILRGFVDSGRLGDAHAYFREIQVDRGASVGALTFNTIMMGFMMAGKMDRVESLYAEMIERKVKPDQFTMSTLVKGYLKRGNDAEIVRRADEWFSEMMTRHGVRPDTNICNTLLKSLIRVQDVDRAREVYEMMRSTRREIHEVDRRDGRRGRSIDARPNAQTYNLLMNASIETGDAPEAIRVFDHMAEDGVRSNTKSYNCLMRAMRENGASLEEMETVFTEFIKTSRAKPNAWSFEIILQKCEDDQNRARAAMWFEKMLEMNVKPSGRRATRMSS